MKSFVVIDVETANPDLRSICQVGVVNFYSAEDQERWQSLIDPEDFFDPFNVCIHGIGEASVRGAPTFPDVYEVLASYLHERVVVSHTCFDRVALQRACDRYGLPRLACTWLDSARVVRRAWPDEYTRSGYALRNVAADLGIHYRPHDALEDAWAAGKVLLEAISRTGIQLTDWLDRVRQPIFPAFSSQDYDPNPEGPLLGEVACFTGALTLPRREAAKLAATAGCTIGTGVTKHTTLLVVGAQDIRKLAGHTQSNKHRKAEQLIAKGQPIRILSEEDFECIVSSSIT